MRTVAEREQGAASKLAEDAIDANYRYNERERYLIDVTDDEENDGRDAMEYDDNAQDLLDGRLRMIEQLGRNHEQTNQDVARVLTILEERNEHDDNGRRIKRRVNDTASAPAELAQCTQ